MLYCLHFWQTNKTEVEALVYYTNEWGKYRQQT